MPFFLTLAGIGPLFAVVARYFVGYQIVRWVAALGLSMVTFTAIEAFTDYVTNFIFTNISNAAGPYWAFAQNFGFPQAVNIIVSAYVAGIGIRKLRGMFNKLTFGKASV